MQRLSTNEYKLSQACFYIDTSCAPYLSEVEGERIFWSKIFASGTRITPLARHKRHSLSLTGTPCPNVPQVLPPSMSHIFNLFSSQEAVQEGEKRLLDKV